VSSLPASAATAVALFAATNVDDLVVLALFSVESRATGRPRRWEIWAGQYLGFAILVGLSLAVGRGLSLILSRWLWLLALIPLAVGVVTLVVAIRQARRPGQSAPPPHTLPDQIDPPGAVEVAAERGPSAVPGMPATGLVSVRGLTWMSGIIGVATLTVVDGADNLAAYTPVFATAGAARIALTLAVFAVGVAVWCVAGALLARHHRVTDTLTRYGRWILPTAFILIALYILHATNAPIRL
jgi:cadmium resistance protein CadD (predicted permease)